MPTVKISDLPIWTYNLTELTDECIDKIAEAVVQKLRAEQTEPTTEDCSMVAGYDCKGCVHLEKCESEEWTDCHYMPITDCPWK